MVALEIETTGYGRSSRTNRREVVNLLRLAGRLRTAGFDVSSTCNLRCEGCYYFSGDRSATEHRQANDLQLWQDFFATKAAEGVNYAYLAGAEPSLEPDRIRAAAAAIPWGMVVTNGTRRIPDEVRYRIHISLWGSEATSGLTRGADVNRKAFANYRDDPRAIFVYTINRQNLDEIEPMVAACAANGNRITFSHFSPTQEYRQKLARNAANDQDFFRFSSDQSHLLLDADVFAKAREIIVRLMRLYPDTILYSMAYDDWISEPGSRYELDENGIATDCAFRADPWFRYYQINRNPSPQKCGLPNMDCSECRTYAPGVASHAKATRGNSARLAVNDQWARSFLIWKDMFLGEQADAAIAAMSGSRSRQEAGV